MSTPKETQLGTLIIVVLKAKNLIDKHTFYKQDVFTQVTLNGETKRTKVEVKGGQHPVWDEELRFPIMTATGKKFRELEVSCWAKEPKTEDTLGAAKFDISETLRTGEFDDWVSLSLNGTTRGDLYLEMTYYAHGPAPAPAPQPQANLLSVAPNTELQRRPSKLSPADRLSRPHYTRPDPSSSSPPSHSPHRGSDAQAPAQTPNGPYLLAPSPPSSRSASASPKGRESPLPPLPEAGGSPPSIPGALAAGRPGPRQGQPQHIPSVLRPRNPKSSTPNSRPAADHLPSTTPPSEYAATLPGRYGATPDPVKYGSVPTQPGTSYNAAPISPYGAPSAASEPWASDYSSPETFSFPVPILPPARDTYDYNAGYQAQDQRHQQPAYQRPPNNNPPYRPPPADANNDLPDPYLQARYQTPLPLPPGTTSPPRGRPQHPPKKDSGDARIQALRAAEAEAARRKEQEEKDLELARQLEALPSPPPPRAASPPRRRHQHLPKKDSGDARILALRAAEAEAARRKQQEEKDLELARQLDLELNTEAEATSTRGARSNSNGMPGSW